MKAVILVGGFGTRLRPLTTNIPKPLVKFCGRPMVEWKIEALVKIGVNEIVLAICYKEDLMQDFMKLMIAKYNIKIICSVETEPLNTGGPIKLAEKYLRATDDSKSDDKIFFVLNSDVICDYPFTSMIDFHKRKNSDITVLVTRVENPGRYGIVVHDLNDFKVQKFVEKPQEYVGDYINAGIYIFSERMLDKIELKNVSLEREIFPKVADEGRMYVMHLENFWKDIGIPSDFIDATQILLKHLYKSGINNIDDFNIIADTNNFIGINLIHKKADIDPEALIGPFCVIHENVKVNKGARVCKSAIESNSTIGRFAHVFNSILAQNVNVGEWTRIDKQSIIAENVKITNDILLVNHKAEPNALIDYQP
jgi:mannose-1-phosphate guanylyltransferase